MSDSDSQGRPLSDIEDGASVAHPDSEEEGEDLMENLEADYRPMPHLDAYETEGIDADFAEDVTMEARAEARLAAEREMARRDRAEGVGGARRRRGLPAALADLGGEGDEDEDDGAGPARRRRRLERAQASGAGATGLSGDGAGGSMSLGAEDVAIELDEARGPVKQWLQQPPVRTEVARRFDRFLRTFTHPRTGEATYRTRVRDMVRANAQSLEVSYVDLAHAVPTLAVWVADHPREVLPILDEAATAAARREFEGHGALDAGVRVRVASLPLQESLRDLRHFHLGQLVRVEGIVTRRTAVHPQLSKVAYDCGGCGALLGPFLQRGDREPRPAACPLCEARGPFTVNAKETSYRNHQRATLAEAPGDVQAGRLPRSKEVLLLDDLVDTCRPGDRVIITGIYAHSWEARQAARTGFPVLSTHIEAVHLRQASGGGSDGSAAALTDEDRAAVRELARDPRVAARIARSVAPRVHGQARAKGALALALFGGREKHPAPGHRLRGDVNVLLLGDPGTAKSQLLRAAADLAPRAVYTTGKGASAVGLTASVRKDTVTGEWTLEGGALVLADRGVACIDEFDKMDETDRVSIHEAMEQQSISVSKAGIVTTLQARCAVLAAANPIGGRYDASRTLVDNVELTDPILSRFDVVCVIRDVVDPVDDERLARFVVATHSGAHPDGGEADAGDGAGPPAGAGGLDGDDDPDAPALIPKELLRKYIAHARVSVRPRLLSGDYDKIARVYAELRRESGVATGMPVAVRHLESMIRMAEAHASMHLRDAVNDDDIDVAIRVMLESFVASQKLSVQKALRRKLGRFIVDRSDYDQLVLFKLQECLREARRSEQVTGVRADPTSYVVSLDGLRDRCRDLEIDDLSPFLRGGVFRKAGFTLGAQGGRQAILFPRE